MNIVLPDELAKKLEQIAETENRPLEAVVASMIDQYAPEQIDHDAVKASLDAIVGIFDDDVSDMSTAVRETLHKYYQDKYGRPD